MALGRRCSSMKLKRSGSTVDTVDSIEEMSLDFAGCSPALGRRCNSMRLSTNDFVGAVDELRLGFVEYKRDLGRKRVAIWNADSEAPPETPAKKLCREQTITIDCGKSQLESLPQDILIRILCGVDHEDLEQLVLVSKSIKNAALIAKEWHFAYSTPKKIPVFRTDINFEHPSELDDIEPPNAPKQNRSHRSRLSRKKLESISVQLFT